MPILRADITGLVLAGGRGLRMGGADKGLLKWHGRALAWHALARLAPQVGPLALSANRNTLAYAAFGVPVWADTVPGFAGPLAGLLSGLQHCSTPWLAVLPCDLPLAPIDLVARLAQALQPGDDLAVAACPGADGLPSVQPLCALIHQRLAPTLSVALARGEHRVLAWSTAQQRAVAAFAEAAAFANLNRPEDLDAHHPVPDRV